MGALIIKGLKTARRRRRETGGGAQGVATARGTGRAVVEGRPEDVRERWLMAWVWRIPQAFRGYGGWGRQAEKGDGPTRCQLLLFGAAAALPDFEAGAVSSLWSVLIAGVVSRPSSTMTAPTA